MMLDHQILGVSPAATLDEIRSAFRHKVRVLHPDASGSSDTAHEFERLVGAYDRLTDGDGCSMPWNPPAERPVLGCPRPTPGKERSFRAHPEYDVEFYLGPSQVAALRSGDIAVPSMVFERGTQRFLRFVVPQSTAHRQVLRYDGFKKDRSHDGNWFFALIRYHWSMVPAALGPTEMRE
jgi:hypothetical protein